MLFALPPIITNAYVAMREVPADVKEAADGMGMTGWQKFWRVELPLSAPLVMSGVRLALVQVWATATIAALVAGPGLGRVITDAFVRTNYGKGTGRGDRRGRGRAAARADRRRGPAAVAPTPVRRGVDHAVRLTTIRCRRVLLRCPRTSLHRAEVRPVPDTRGHGRGTQKDFIMQLRRSLAAAIAVGSLFLATSCAGDDLAEDDPSDSSSQSGMTPRPPPRVAR